MDLIPVNTQTLMNIANLASGSFDSNRRIPTRKMDVAISQIAKLNHQELKDHEIACYLCDIHRCAVVRMERIERRAKELLAFIASRRSPHDPS